MSSLNSNPERNVIKEEKGKQRRRKKKHLNILEQM
jgi:hypothetical protein